MKQFVFLCLLMVGGAVGGLVHPFWAVLVYYTLAVLRPQYLWDWALPMQVRWSLIAAMLVLVTVALHATRLFQRGRFNTTAALMLGYALLVMISVLTAYDPQLSQAWAVDLAKVMLLAMIATLVIDRLWQVRIVAGMIGLALAYIAYEINFLYFFHNARLDVFHYGFGGLDNNGAGLMLAMGLPFAYCFALARDRRVRLAALIAAPLLLHAVMLTYSRGAMLAAVVGLLWIGWHHRPRWQALATAPLVVVLALALAGAEIRAEFLSMRRYQQDHSAQSRFDSWAAAWQMAWDHPVFGAGLRNSNHYSRNYGADRPGRTIHNQYLQIAADSGIPAATVYLLMLGSAIWRVGVARGALLRPPHPADDAEDDSPGHDRAEAAHLCLAVQTSLVIFAFDGIFLSLETFELPWLLVVLAGVLPGVVQRHFAAVDQPAPQPAAHDRPFVFAAPIPRHAAEPAP